MEVVPGLFTTGPIPRVTDFEDTGGPFFLDSEGHNTDPLIDDQALFFEAKDGTVVLLGCAHAGVINTLRHVKSLTGNRPVSVVIGGMHLVQATAQRVQWTIEELRRLRIAQIAPAHCTGSVAVEKLQRSFQNRCIPCHVGTTFTFESPPMATAKEGA
jgi:7,8-dihydropterin-6-yl-methyl-4-(beta-D-ribofuranosyl)aminobenzene 5'-phosphate synthase